MSFTQSWLNLENRTVAFNLGAGDSRPAEQVLLDIQVALGTVRALLDTPMGPSQRIPPYTVVEELMGQALSDFMFVCGRMDWSVPEAMIQRNTLIRSTWREKSRLPKTERPPQE